jgi:hypothetical protein
MKRQSNVRRLTVSYCPTNNERGVIPYLRLKGKWLEQAGFSIGNYVQVEIEQGRLIIAALHPDLKGVKSEIKSLETKLAVLKEQEAHYGGLL